jgi:hypothetical protein
MKKNVAGIGWFVSKAMCVALTLILGVTLFAAGAFAESGCGEKCRCHSRPPDRHHATGVRIPLSAGFCSGNPMIPCDLESSRASDVPQFILSSAGGGLPNIAGPAGIATGSPTGKHNFRGYQIYQLLREKSRSAPKYLQNLSLLI